MSHIYHITTAAEWEKAKPTGAYASASLALEGFNHCCTEAQVEGVLQRYFAGKPDLVKLTIDTEKLKSQLVYDWSPSVQDTFPHIYGPINVDSVVEVEKLS
ncbi:DUF952 domain-containing protein [Pollutibacter soli]|uniref:DUF952 domain-containing protein n=1 Tax=Pollutibacter soli TaxID=3034157 RepID=UPI00301333C3